VQLNGASLSGANFYGADLKNTDLCDALLMNANLSEARLVEASFARAKLIEVNFNGARIDKTVFYQAQTAYTLFVDVDLSTAIGLESCVQLYPSTIGIDTIFKSKGKIPEVFLRGAGVPEDLIKYIPALVGAGIEFYSCFISYSSQDDEFARRLHARMQQEKLRVWFAPEDMKGGKKFLDQIDEAIRVHDKLLLVLSDASITSNWVMQEIRRARKREKKEGRQTFFPIRLTDMNTLQEWECVDPDSGEDLALEVRKYHLPDFTNWKEHDAFEAAFAKLLRDLRRSEAGGGGTAP